MSTVFEVVQKNVLIVTLIFVGKRDGWFIIKRWFCSCSILLMLLDFVMTYCLSSLFVWNKRLQKSPVCCAYFQVFLLLVFSFASFVQLQHFIITMQLYTKESSMTNKTSLKEPLQSWYVDTFSHSMDEYINVFFFGILCGNMSI